MFVLTTISDVIQISPSDFNKPSAHALEDNIHKKYANKVVQNVGLCISFWDFLKVSDGQIIGGNPNVQVNVTFRIIVFRPFKGEIIQATILHLDAEGMRLSLDFFHDIWVPKALLHPNSEFSPQENAWIWETSNGRFYYEYKEHVRFRVESEVWCDQIPEKPRLTEDGDIVTDPLDKKVPYTVIGSMATDGMGPIFWWEGEAEEDAAPSTTA